MFRSFQSFSLWFVIASTSLSGCGDVVAAVMPPAACEPMRNAVNAGATRIGQLSDQADEPSDFGALADEQDRFAASVAAVTTDDPELIAIRDEYAAVYRGMAEATRRMFAAAAADGTSLDAVEAELDALATREEAAARRLEARCP